MKTRRTLLALVLSIMMVIGLFPITAMAGTASDVSYLDADGTTKTVTECTVIEAGTTTWNAGWYVVNRDVTIGSAESSSRVTVSGNVHLILADGCTLTVNGGINVADDDSDIINGSLNSLTIYAQSTDKSTMGKLIAQNVTGEHGAIGSENGSLGGTITINGGSVQAVGSNGQGNSFGIRAGNVTVNGGSVEAKGGSIGNGFGIFAGNVTVNGGSVEAVGGDANYNSCGIFATNVTVNGGSVEAKGGNANHSHGIFATNVTVTGGSAVVFASSIFNSTDRKNWNGIVFEGNNGQVYGDATIPNGATLTVAENATLTVAENATLTIAEGAALTIENGATVNGNGAVIIYGTLTIDEGGTLSNRKYVVTIVDGGNNATGAGNYAKDDEVSLNAGTKEGYTFAGWTSEEVTVDENGKFTMPAKDVTVTAKWTENPVEPVQPEPPSEPEYIPIPDPDYTAPVYRDTWHKSGKNWYFYDEDGRKVKGWFKDGNTWYYLSEKTGAMVYGGMLEIDGETYYFYDWGGMASNWWYLDEETGDWYYFRGNGAMAKNTWIEWKGEWYYLGADGRMLTATTTPDGYRVDANGKWIR